MRVNKRRREAEAAIDLLLDAVVKIRCDQCQKKNAIKVPVSDGDEAATYFYDEGWRVVGDELLCRKCRRKR